MRKTLKIIAHIMAIVLLYMALSTAMFLGLQVRPIYGTIGLVFFIALVGLYVYLGFLRKNRKGKRSRKKSLPQADRKSNTNNTD